MHFKVKSIELWRNRLITQKQRGMEIFEEHFLQLWYFGQRVTISLHCGTTFLRACIFCQYVKAKNSDHTKTAWNGNTWRAFSSIVIFWSKSDNFTALCNNIFAGLHFLTVYKGHKFWSWFTCHQLLVASTSYLWNTCKYKNWFLKKNQFLFMLFYLNFKRWKEGNEFLIQISASIDV